MQYRNKTQEGVHLCFYFIDRSFNNYFGVFTRWNSLRLPEILRGPCKQLCISFIHCSIFTAVEVSKRCFAEEAEQIKRLTFPFSKKRAVFIWSLYLYLQSIRIRKRLNDSQRHSHEAGGFDLKKIKVKSSSNQKKTNGGKWKTQDRRYYKCVHVGSRALKQ